MTTHYADIAVLPGPETRASQLLGALCDKLHLAFVQHRVDCIGISFPGYSTTPQTLGTTLRVHGSPDTLHGLIRTDWLKGMRDHVRVAEVAIAPPNATHRTVSRRQFKTSVERLRRRRMRRKGETAEQAARAIPTTVEQRPTLPYVHVRSRSTGQPFCLFIALGPPLPSPVSGRFNCYGLSGDATVPWF